MDLQWERKCANEMQSKMIHLYTIHNTHMGHRQEGKGEGAAAPINPHINAEKYPRISAKIREHEKMRKKSETANFSLKINKNRGLKQNFFANGPFFSRQHSNS